MKTYFYWLLFTFALLTLSACALASDDQANHYLDLNELQELPTPAEQEARPLKMAVAAVKSQANSALAFAISKKA